MTGHPRNRFILLSITSYVVCGLLWILLSDHLLLLFADADALTRLSTAKGVFFVIATAAVFFFLLRAVPPSDAMQRESLLGALTLSIDRERRPHWFLYLFAVVITAAMMLLRLNIPFDFSTRPILILFMLPIVLCALLGGLGPGLFATALAALATDLAAEPHFHSAAASPWRDTSTEMPRKNAATMQANISQSAALPTTSPAIAIQMTSTGCSKRWAPNPVAR